MLDICPSPAAEALRDSIRIAAAEGQSVDQLVEWIIAQPRRGVARLPEARGAGLWAWLIPPIALLLGVGRARVRHAPAAPEAGDVPSLPAGARCPEERARLAAALAELERVEQEEGMTLLLASVLMAIAVGYWVIHPILARRGALIRDVTAGNVLDAEARKRVALTELKEIEYDYLGGKLDEADYREMRERISREALVRCGPRFARRGIGRRRSACGGRRRGARLRLRQPGGEPLLLRAAARGWLDPTFAGGAAPPALEARAARKVVRSAAGRAGHRFFARGRHFPDRLRAERGGQDDAAADAVRGGPPDPRRDPLGGALLDADDEANGGAPSASCPTRPFSTPG
jgi:hypothetical protein